MGFIKEFREFAVKGNVMDMAVGVIIGGAFGKIVTSFVNDVIMPIVSIFTGNVNFNELKWIITPETVDAAGVTTPEVALLYGSFIQTVIDFIILALIIFLMVKSVNKLKKKEEKPVAPAAKPADILLLEEIRDLLKK